MRIIVLTGLGWLSACGSQTPLLSMLFDIPPTGKDPGAIAVVHSARRSPTVEREQLAVSKEYLADLLEAQRAGPPPDWPAIFKNLPKDDEDNIDWNQALRDKVISPKPGIDPASPETEVLDLDVLLATSGKPERSVVFSHKVHGQWHSCANCHSAIFAEKAGSAKITMKAMDDGKYCGVCHDKVAIAMPASCKGCHTAPTPSKKAG